jgi:putative membrane protein
MLWLKRALGFVLVIILVAATLIFVLENQQEVTLSYLGFSTAAFPVSLFVVAAFVLGGLLGLLLAGLALSRLRYRLRVLEGRLAREAQRRPQDAPVSVVSDRGAHAGV